VFGWLAKSAPYVDPELGELRHARGRWRGTIALDGGRPVPLVLSGGRAAPDDEALRLARAIPAESASWRAQVEPELFAHLEPYAEAVAAGELEAPTGGLPRIAAPSEIWPHVTAEFVRVERIDGAFVVEVGYRVAWDEEHTLGARFRDGRLRELNGSVLAP
jgi:hypothetical protein